MNNKKSDALVVVDRFELRALCTQALEHINAVRQKEEIEFLTIYQNRYNANACISNNKWLCRHRFVKPIKRLETIEETKKYLDICFEKSKEYNFGWGDKDYNYRSIYALHTKTKIETLLNCCNSWSIKSSIWVDSELFSDITVLANRCITTPN